MEIVNKDIGQLKPYEKNPRKNADAVPYVANSISKFGFKVPIVIDKDDVIIAGHTRYLAAQELGLKTVPCIVASDLTKEQVKAFRLADNKVAEKATWDSDLLSMELDELADLDFDMAEFGFSLDVDIDQEETDLSDSISSTYEVIVECANEFEQEDIFSRLQSEGLKCRVLTL